MEVRGVDVVQRPGCLASDFDLPREAKQLTSSLVSEQVRELVVLSAFPKREFLQCMERVGISPPFSHKLVFHLYKTSLGLAGLTKKAFTDVSVRVTYDSSAAVVLCGRLQSVDHVRFALGRQDSRNDGAAPASTGEEEEHPQRRDSAMRGGLTVTGTVVSSAEDAGTAAQARRSEKQTQAALEGRLRLRLRVRAGSVAVKKIRLDLYEKVKLIGNVGSDTNSTYTLATYTHKTNIHPNEAVEFVVSLELPRQFRRTQQDSSKFLPPAGITTAVLHTATWLQITLPDLNAVPEQLLEEGVVMVAEDVDLTDTVPFLPNSYCPWHHASSDPAKALK